MGLGTKNRENQTAETCRAHLREAYPAQLSLVEEYITELEGTGKNHDITRWRQFSDIKGITDEMLTRVDTHFEKWLNP